MHRKGRFGALTVVVKDGNIEFVSFNASMLPDNPQQRYALLSDTLQYYLAFII